jgi:glyoxylase-like metal-dependent hydrolase (beta-lactamase superfamily II)
MSFWQSPASIAKPETSLNLKVADRWFETQRIDDDITLIFEPHVVPLLRCNIWHVRGRDRDLIIDTGLGIVSLHDFAKKFLDKPVTAIATHVHLDHIGSHHEFEDCRCHSLEIEGLQGPSRQTSLAGNEFDPSDLATLLIPTTDGYEISGPMITALPYAGYDLSSFTIKGAPHARSIHGGEMIELGNRAFELLHLPGHSPGGIGLWEVATKTLFSGDAVYDGPLIDNLHHSNLIEYSNTMLRLLDISPRVIHAGHDPSFGSVRLNEIAKTHLAKWSDTKINAGILL